MNTTTPDGQPWEAPEDTFQKERAGLLDNAEAGRTSTDESLYVILNLPKTATVPEIRDRYRELAVLLHPDKAPVEHRPTAETKFREVKRAYEVLVDPERRAAYDALGAEALDLPEWRLRQRYDFEKARDDFARMSAHRADMVTDRLLSSTSNSMDAVVDASGLFSTQRREGDPLLQVRQLSLATGFKSEITPGTTVRIQGSLQKGDEALHEDVSRGNELDQADRNSSQSMMGTIQHQFSPSITFTARARLLKPYNLALGAGYVINPYTRVQLYVASPLRRIAPATTISLHRRLHAHGEGKILWNSGSSLLNRPSSLAITYSRVSIPSRSTSEPVLIPKTQATETSIHVSPGTGIGLDLTHSIHLTRALTLSLNGQCGLKGITTLILRSDLQVMNGLKLSCAMSTGIAGLSFHIGVVRKTSRLGIPVFLCPPGEYHPAVALVLGLIPAVAMYTVDRRLLKPRKQDESRSRLDALREEHADTIRERREEAGEVIELMREHVARRVDAEIKVDGLIIEAAWYGSAERINAVSAASTSSGPSISPLPSLDQSDESLVDARVPMQNLVHKSQLVIPGGRSKSGLLGFWDPCWGQRKKLLVRYRFRGRAHEALVDDSEALLIPMRGHALE
ncbi:hypothetical protein FRB94_000638 [Tulasnella sp. JGI-2019a]|nr:hypothetical protein FRB94_000638 [Tulasnella sp. JGI-2019a]KAG9032878.1 hypothetical protein FRB95_000893 [Tulasnella sp. JGI-2019a]